MFLLKNLQWLPIIPRIKSNFPAIEFSGPRVTTPSSAQDLWNLLPAGHDYCSCTFKVPSASQCTQGGTQMSPSSPKLGECITSTKLAFFSFPCLGSPKTLSRSKAISSSCTHCVDYISQTPLQLGQLGDQNGAQELVQSDFLPFRF